MRIAAFGGAYANPYALEAMLADASTRGCERILNLGDLALLAEPDPPESVAELLRGTRA